MEFEHSFFENEVRNGFYVPTMMKRCWAAEIEITLLVDSICKKHNIRYFAAYGTLLGAVREAGFIPWDDDIDLFMLRGDYERFLMVLDNELPDGFGYTCRRKNFGTTNGVTAISYTGVATYEKEALEKNHGFIFPASVDVFPLDNIPDSPEEQQSFRDLLMMINTIWFNYDSLSDEDKNKVVDGLSKNYNIRFNNKEPIKQQLAFLSESVEAMYNDCKTESVAFVTFWTQKRPNEVLPRKAFLKELELPFENVKLPVPADYLSVLKGLYGDFSKRKRISGGHTYPAFLRRRDRLDKNLYKSFFYDFTFEKREKMLEERDDLFSDIKREKKKVLFIISKYNDWRLLRGIYEEADRDENVDCGLIVVPYYETTGLEKWGYVPFKEPVYDTNRFNEDLKYINYNDYDLGKELPDIIVTAEPYDQFNDAMMLPSNWMCKNIRKYCRELVYVQHFIIDEFNEDDGFSNAASEFYSCVPGVMLSDRIIVQSDLIKKAYLRAIETAYGEHVSKFFDDKIYGAGSPLWDDESSNHFSSIIWNLINGEEQ